MEWWQGRIDGEQRHDAGEERDRELLPGAVVVDGTCRRGHRRRAGTRRGGTSSSSGGGEEKEEGAASARAHCRRRHWQAAAQHHRQEELQVPWGQQVPPLAHLTLTYKQTSTTSFESASLDMDSMHACTSW